MFQRVVRINTYIFKGKQTLIKQQSSLWQLVLDIITYLKPKKKFF